MDLYSGISNLPKTKTRVLLLGLGILSIEHSLWIAGRPPNLHIYSQIDVSICLSKFCVAKMREGWCWMDELDGPASSLRWYVSGKVKYWIGFGSSSALLSTWDKINWAINLDSYKYDLGVAARIFNELLKYVRGSAPCDLLASHLGY